MIQEVELVPSAARGVTGTNTAGVLAPSGGRRLRVSLDVSAASGTSPTLDVTVIGLINGREFVIGTFTQAVAVTAESIFIDLPIQEVRIDWAIGGAGPSFTFSVDAVVEV